MANPRHYYKHKYFKLQTYSGDPKLPGIVMSDPKFFR